MSADEALRPTNAGTLKSIEMAEDDGGRTVMRVIVDFYDGNFPPDINFKTVWNRTPVTIAEVRSHE